MRRLAGVLLFVMGLAGAGIQDSWAQTPYLFETFKKGQVFYSSGKTGSGSFNYNGVTEEMVYLKGGKRLALDDLEKIMKVLVGEKVFFPFEGKLYQKEGSGELGTFIRHKYRLIKPGKPSGYGGDSQTTASTSYSSLSDSKMLYELKLPEDYRIVKVREFYFLVDGVLRKVNNKKQLKKIFPKKYKSLLGFVKEQDIDFSVVTDMNRLAEFIEK